MIDGAGTHAALMDKVYRRQRYIYDLTRKYYLFGRDRLIRELALRPGQTVVEVGCGTARNLIRIARLYPGARLFGLDASAEMLRTATQNIAAAGLSDRIGLVQGYAEGLSPALFGLERPFDRVLFPYSLSMIPDWKQALRVGANALADDGEMQAVDFGDLTGLGPVGAALLLRWLRLFHVAPRVEILRTVEGKSPGGEGGRPAGRLRLLPGRYAFLWKCSKEEWLRADYFHVAPQTQPGGNSHARSAWPTTLVDIPPQHPSQ
jgi:S-adenosylmethionine-diacylgycerolhomoserine-N-methlytransferase